MGKLLWTYLESKSHLGNFAGGNAKNVKVRENLLKNIGQNRVLDMGKRNKGLLG